MKIFEIFPNKTFVYELREGNENFNEKSTPAHMVGGPGIGGYADPIWPHGKHKDNEVIRDNIGFVLAFFTLIVNNKALSYGLQVRRPFYTW